MSEKLPTKVALLKVALITIHELIQKEEIDRGRIKALIEETFEQLTKCSDNRI